MHQIDQIFVVAPEICSVAIYRQSRLTSRQREDVAGASAAESDRYEALLVNPAQLPLPWSSPR